MPLTLLFYMVGALSISGAPLFNGFVSKSMVVASAGEDGRAAVFLLLALASVGTFLSVALKLPYYAWVAPGARLEAREAPLPMLLAMGGTALLCVLLGVAPGLLYARLPFTPVAYRPYVASHLFEVLVLMAFSALAFWQLRPKLQPHRGLILDTDWFYRRGARWLVAGVAVPLAGALERGGSAVAAAVERLKSLTRNPPSRWARPANSRTSPRGLEEDDWYDPDRQRPPVSHNLAWILLLFAAVGWIAVFSGMQ
jgi:NADH:ubiquinone oxidoreductase subunit 5 (subunit L)/multisubunit Na+/H+ antiporter MnhA subunit